MIYKEWIDQRLAEQAVSTSSEQETS